MMNISVPVRTCMKCGVVYVVPYIPSLGIQAVLAMFFGLFGLIYWWIRGRGIRCPRCHSKDCMVTFKEIEA